MPPTPTQGRDPDTAAFQGWRPQKSIDHVSRRAKAQKVVALLEAWTPLEGKRVLDVGTGGGATAAALADAVGPSGDVVGVDVVDLRIVRDGYHFEVVSGTALPFPDSSFDIAVSSHVIEHVGGRVEQRIHLNELRRVLVPNGNLYLATPNRWALLEPHFRLPLLTWLPRGWRTPYVRATRRGKVCDVDPLGPRELRNQLGAAAFDVVDQTYDAMRVMLRTESIRGPRSWALRLPPAIVGMLKPLVPTYVFRGIAR
jgi:SAM-dependent methyltransferase